MFLYIVEVGGCDCEGVKIYLHFMYKGASTLPIKHSIDLIRNDPLPNGPIYIYSLLDNVEIKCYIQELI